MGVSLLPSVFQIKLTSIHSFNFDRVLDPVSGQPIEIKGLDFLPGFLSFPAPFDCSVSNAYACLLSS